MRSFSHSRLSIVVTLSASGLLAFRPGLGGTMEEGQIEIQSDQRETVARILSEAGFRPVFAGG